MWGSRGFRVLGSWGSGANPTFLHELYPRPYTLDPKTYILNPKTCQEASCINQNFSQMVLDPDDARPQLSNHK